MNTRDPGPTVCIHHWNIRTSSGSPPIQVKSAPDHLVSSFSFTGNRTDDLNVFNPHYIFIVLPSFKKKKALKIN